MAYMLEKYWQPQKEIQMMPITFEVVEGEKKEYWTWFLELLIEDLGGRTHCRAYKFIS